MTTNSRNVRTFFFLLSISAIAAAIPARASFSDGLYLNMYLGLGSITPSSDFFADVGQGATAGNQGLQANASVVRDASSTVSGWMPILGAGYRSGFIAFETRGKYTISATGSGTHYFRGQSTTIGSENADYHYRSFSADAGPRFFLSDVFSLRPYIAFVTYGINSFTFGSQNGFGGSAMSEDETDIRRGYGGTVSFVDAKTDGTGLEVGVDYMQYDSTFGKAVRQVMVIFGVNVSFSSNHSKSSK